MVEVRGLWVLWFPCSRRDHGALPCFLDPSRSVYKRWSQNSEFSLNVSTSVEIGTDLSRVVYRGWEGVRRTGKEFGLERRLVDTRGFSEDPLREEGSIYPNRRHRTSVLRTDYMWRKTRNTKQKSRSSGFLWSLSPVTTLRYFSLVFGKSTHSPSSWRSTNSFLRSIVP